MKKTFMIEDENGQTKEASVITMINIEDRKYLIYSIKENNNMSTICASKVIKDENNKDKLIDLENNSDKEKIMNFINSLSK